jgi:FKBP-type peptidyl-prolyl cis-trans isomerase 2
MPGLKEEEMRQARRGDNVDVHCTTRLDDRTTVETSLGGDPLRCQIGESKLLPAIEFALIGMGVGQSKTLAISAGEAYGPRREELVAVVPRNQVPGDFTPELGVEVIVHQREGTGLPARVSEVTDSTITFDANHPLAGKDLIFDIVLFEIL